MKLPTISLLRCADRQNYKYEVDVLENSEKPKLNSRNVGIYKMRQWNVLQKVGKQIANGNLVDQSQWPSAFKSLTKILSYQDLRCLPAFMTKQVCKQ